MTGARKDGRNLFVLGAIIFIAAGVFWESSTPAPLMDFRTAYYSARCLVRGCDPYRQSDVARLFGADAELMPRNLDAENMVVTRNVYLPSEFALTVPFALLPFRAAAACWIAAIALSLVLAAWLMWNAGSSYSPLLTGALLFVFLANCESLLVGGNPAALAVALCTIAAWCFVTERFTAAGILCLALSLALKPHDSGFVWLYFLLAGGANRRRALATLMVVAIIAVPMVLWVTHLSPHWLGEMHSNLLAFSAHGGINDPGPASSGGHGIVMITDLQAAIAPFWDDPRVYNSASYAICAPLFLILIFVTVRSAKARVNAWFALASIAALSMLPLYHRQYDAKLILLTVPACAILRAEGGAIGWIAVLVNLAGILVTADIPWAIFLGLLAWLHGPNSGLAATLLTIAQTVPVPFTLLALGAFYLWIYAVRSLRAPRAEAAAVEAAIAPTASKR
jgi:hypothetical protein